MERRFGPHNSRQHRTRRLSYTTDDEDPLGRMSDLESDHPSGNSSSSRPSDYLPLLRRRRSSSISLTASPSSSSQKMSIDSDDGRSVSSVSAGGASNNRLSSFLRQPYIFPPDMPPPQLPRRLTRSLSSELGNTNSWSSPRPSPQPDFAIDEIMADENAAAAADATSTRKVYAPAHRPGFMRRSSSAERIPHHHRHHHRSASSSSAEASGSHSPVRRNDPERRSVTRRSSLFPRSKALARVICQADEETRPADVEMRRERDMTQQIKTRLGKMSMDAEASSSSSSKAIASGSVPAVAWARIRDVDSSPTMAPYHASKLNPEMEMTNFQFDNLPSPMHQGYKSIKRKASEDRFEPYPTNSLKRRAVSPSVSASGSPVLSAISSPPYSFYGSSPTSNAAARAQQKPGQLSSFNLQDASGGLSRMSLSE